MKHLLSILLCLSIVCSLPAQTRSPKRGVSFDFNNNADLSALQPGTSWFYNWGTTPNANIVDSYNSIYGYEFCPMAWNGGYNASAIRSYVQVHPECKYILAFNEPNLTDQAYMTPQQAASAWPALKALAQELNLKIISPACNYSGWAQYGSPQLWFDAFFKLVDINDVDGIAIHSYMGWSIATLGYVEQYYQLYKKPIWLTEVCQWDNFNTNQGGTALQQRREMIDLIDSLERTGHCARYAWFIPRRDEYTTPTYPYMELLTNANGTEKGVLTETGQVFTYMSSYDTTFYHDTDVCIEAEQYIYKSKGVYLEQTSDTAGILDIYDYSSNDTLTYNVNVPETDTYTVRLRMLSNVNSTLNITSAAGTVSQTVASTSNVWANQEFQLALNAGKQQISFKITSGSLLLNYFVITNTGATPNPMPNPPGGIPPPPPPVGDNLALNKPIVSASASTDLGAAKLAVDGDPATRWESKHGEDNKMLTLDLQKDVAISDILINWEGAYAAQYTVEISTDSVQWTQVYSTTSGAAGVQRITLSDTPAGRYLRINCIKRGTVYGFSIWEIEVYGTIIDLNHIADVKQEAVSLYPNPVKDRLYIRPEDNITSVVLSDISGRRLFEQHNASAVDMTGYTSGIYLLTIHYTNGETTERKVIKR